MLSKRNNSKTIEYYNHLIDENNDSVNDIESLVIYMNKWDGLEFINELELSMYKNVLEVGVGTGRLAIRICNKCNRFFGIDISPKTIEKARYNLKNFQNVKLICDDFNNYHFNENFDVIYSSLTFMHIQDKKKTIKKIYGLLNPHGRLVLSIDKNEQKYINYGKNYKIKIYPDSYMNTLTLLNASGLKIINTIEKEFGIIFTAIK